MSTESEFYDVVGKTRGWSFGTKEKGTPPGTRPASGAWESMRTSRNTTWRSSTRPKGTVSSFSKTPPSSRTSESTPGTGRKS